ncbi:hypothetical protein DSO57_1005570 [Entomophthora muscae]|uniref:Uncharacterized protein n=1 Tax=Entomophthora muscae TaxID=34485 RepID=A0ACC2UHJ5_9FUNG|nr:hypothetical protein DSO57_1005570 [Entomophthora muscae]
MHFPLLENENPFHPAPGYNPGHTLGTDGQEPHTRTAIQEYEIGSPVKVVQKVGVDSYTLKNLEDGKLITQVHVQYINKAPIEQE